MGIICCKILIPLMEPAKAGFTTVKTKLSLLCSCVYTGKDSYNMLVINTTYTFTFIWQ